MIAVPDLLTADQAQQLFGPLPAPGGGLASEQGEVLRRVVRGAPVGPVTVFYRVIEATAEEYGIGGHGAVHDQYGRPILVTEGIVIRGVSDGVLRVDLEAALREAHTLVVPAFQDFWERDEEFTQAFMIARNLSSSGTDAQVVERVVDVPESDVTTSRVHVSHQRGLGVRLLAAVFVMMAGLVAGVIAWQWWPTECGGAFSDFRLNDDENRECIGITDGDFLFNNPNETTSEADRDLVTRINAVQQKIAAENREVATADRYVKVVLLMPLTVSQAKPSAMSLEQILHSLEGSYTGLMRVNHTNNFGDSTATKIQLLLANQGSQLESGADFINDLLEESQPEHPVVAVVGLGVSRPDTIAAAEHLAERGIPMVSAMASADDLTDHPLFWSVSPSDTEYARSLRRFLDNQDMLRSGLIVYGQNPDLYTQSLAHAYRVELGPYIRYPEQPFRASTAASPAVAPVFDPVVRNICDATRSQTSPLDMVFYAGREVDFDEFAQALNARTCKDRSLTVLIGSTGFAAMQSYTNVLESSNVTIVLASLSDSSDVVGAPSGHADFLTAYDQYGSGEKTDFVAGYAIAYHDALVTAAQAVRLAASNRPTQVPDSRDVASDGFGHLNLAHEVRAASGTLSFPPEGGRATGQLITVRQIE